MFYGMIYPAGTMDVEAYCRIFDYHPEEFRYRPIQLNKRVFREEGINRYEKNVEAEFRKYVPEEALAVIGFNITLGGGDTFNPLYYAVGLALIPHNNGQATVDRSIPQEGENNTRKKQEKRKRDYSLPDNPLVDDRFRYLDIDY